MHSIRLAENPWFCDCKLRNLIRRLAFKSSFGNSPKPSNLNQTSSMILTINSLISSSGHLLEDEPECESSSWYQLNSNSWKRMDQLGSGSEQSNQETRWNMEHKKGTSLWTNMSKLDIITFETMMSESRFVCLCFLFSLCFSIKLVSSFELLLSFLSFSIIIIIESQLSPISLRTC